MERLGRTLSETVGVGEEGDCGAGVHKDMSTHICNNNINNKTYKSTDMVSFTVNFAYLYSTWSLYQLVIFLELRITD